MFHCVHFFMLGSDASLDWKGSLFETCRGELVERQALFAQLPSASAIVAPLTCRLKVHSARSALMGFLPDP